MSLPACPELCRGGKLFLVCFFIFSSNFLFAQEPFVRQRETNPNYREGDWISYSIARYVTSIAVGRQYVYFGTRHSGITRFDQYKMTWDFPFTVSNGLTDNSVWAVAYDESTSLLWCATQNAISYYRSTSGKWYNQFNEEFGLPFSDVIESIGVGRNKIYFESRNGRLFESQKFGGIILLSNDQNLSANRNIKWFGQRANRPREFPHFFMMDGYIFDPNGVVEDRNFRKAEVVAAVEDEWGNMWVATWGLGAGKADVRALRLEMLEFGLGSQSVNTMAFADDILWAAGRTVAEINRGITAWDLQRERWDFYEQRNISELRSGEINQVTPDGSRIWFSTNYGLSNYNSETARWETFTSFDGLQENIIFDVAVDDSSIWVGTANGINEIERASLAKRDSVKIRDVSPGNLGLINVRDLELMKNLLWAATDNGVYVYDTAKKEGGFVDEIDGPISTSINSISTNEDEVWFGSNEGVDVFDVQHREWLGVPEGRACPRSRIHKIVATPVVARAATNEGVKKYDRAARTWRTFTTEDGLLDDRVNTILMDGDFVWFGTESGVTQFFWNDDRRID